MEIYTISDYINKFNPDNPKILFCGRIWGKGENEAHHAILMRRNSDGHLHAVNEVTGELSAQDLRK